MTFDEKEAKLVELFDKLNEKIKQSRDVSNCIVELQKLKGEIVSQIVVLKRKNREAEGILIGKGRFAHAVLAPSRLKSELDNLQNRSVNPYNGIVNEAALKEYEGKKQVLMEDIELAEINAELAEVEAKNIYDSYIEAKKQRRHYNKMITTNVRMLNHISKELKRINKEIRSLDKIVVEEEIVRTK